MIGRGSWFGGPHDPSDSGHTASGGTTAEPGIAVYNHKTLGGYWRVKAPNGKTVVLKQTDIGPAPWTNRKVDVTYSALGQIGYSEHNFPTDGQFSAEYLGRNPARAVQSNMRHQASRQVVRQVSPGQTLFDSLGYGKAAQHAAGVRGVASLFGGSGVGDTALRSALEEVGTPPNPKDYESTTPPTFTSGPLIKTPSGSFYSPHSNGKYVHPIPGGTVGRTDMGVDISAKPGTPIRAIGDSKVLAIRPDWYAGQPYVELELQNGPHKGKVYYVAEQITPQVKPGQYVRGGHPIGHVAPHGTALELGWGRRGGRTEAQATTGYHEGQVTPAGQHFHDFLKGLR